jgi:hypothetical protein
MPINPLYQFIEPGAGDIEGRNQVLNFLQQDAQRTGMPLNYQRELGNAQEQMNVMDPAKERLNMGQAPVAPRPRVPMQQIRDAQLPMSPNGPAPELQSPVPPESKSVQGLGGMARQEEVPMTMPGAAGEQLRAPTPQSLPYTPTEQLPRAEMTLPDRFEQTTMAQKARESGWDPRALMAAMAQFSGEFGNLYGKATPSSAQPYYEQMMDSERKAQAAAQKAREAALDRDMREREFQARYAPKPVSSDMALKYEMIKNQSEALKNKMRVEQELNDPMSERSKSLKQAYEAATGQKLPEGVAGSDVYRIMPITTRSIEAQKGREFQAVQGALNRQAAAQRQGATLASRQGGAAPMPGEPVTQVPGWQKVENVPVEKTELQQFRRRTAAVPRVVQKIKQLKELIGKYGPYENEYSAAGQQMMSLANDIKLDLKGPEFKALGVLAGPDMAILEALVPDTSSLKNMAKSSSAVNASLDSLAKRLEEDLDASGTSIGFSRGQQQQQPAVGPRGKKLWTPGG